MLSIRNIHKRFGDTHAMNDISLDLKPGLFGLLGPNGAGKSTLMRTLATLQKPDAGTITYDGIDIISQPNAMRSVLGYLPQDFGVYPRMSAKALLDHIAVLKGVNVDEPTAGLDPFERQRFLDLLSEAGEDKIIILSTHIVEDVRDLCPDMAIMGEGKIVARGAPEALIDKIRGKVWRKKIDKDKLDVIKETYQFLSSRYLMGGVIVSVLSDDKPEAGFEKSDVILEDAYFAHLNGLV